MQNMSEKDKAVLGPALGVAGEYSIQRLLLQFSSKSIRSYLLPELIYFVQRRISLTGLRPRVVPK